MIISDDCRKSAEFNHCFFGSGCKTKIEFCRKHCKSNECKYKRSLK